MVIITVTWHRSFILLLKFEIKNASEARITLYKADPVFLPNTVWIIVIDSSYSFEYRKWACINDNQYITKVMSYYHLALVA